MADGAAGSPGVRSADDEAFKFSISSPILACAWGACLKRCRVGLKLWRCVHGCMGDSMFGSTE